MIINPIIPVWLMSFICIVLIIFLLRNSNLKKNIINILIILIIFCINLRVMYPNGEVEIAANDLEVLFVVDNTISMNALDYQGDKPRLDGVREDVKYIIKELNEAKFSIITFDNKAKRIVPFTKDSNMAINAIDVINPLNEIYAKGSNLNIVKEELLKSLKETNKNEKKKVILFFISDGEITDEKDLESFSEVKQYVLNGAVLGYGTSSGGYMMEYDKYSDKYDYIIDRSNFKWDKAVSRIDENNLKIIAKDINISYINMNRQNNIYSKLNEIKRIALSSNDSSYKKNYEDTYFILIIPLLILLFIKYIKVKEEML